ncbi:MAG: glycosyltransferase family 2 protein [Candidatus Kerfeldbacteria bacterium]
MKVSVVCPVHNEEAIIEQSLSSLLRQTVLPNEVIIVDNNSTDRTYSIIKSLQPKFEKRGVYLVPLSCVNGNQIEARILGFGTAKHELIVSMDADTVFKIDWFEKATKFFSANPDVVAVGGRILYDDAVITFFHSLVFFFYRLFPRRYNFYGSNAAFRKGAYLESDGLKGCRMTYETKKFQEPYDDVYLSFMLKVMGQVVPVPELIVHGLSRKDGEHVSLVRALGRLLRQLRETLWLQKHLLNKVERATISRNST